MGGGGWSLTHYPFGPVGLPLAPSDLPLQGLEGGHQTLYKVPRQTGPRCGPPVAGGAAFVVARGQGGEPVSLRAFVGVLQRGALVELIPQPVMTGFVHTGR